MFTMDAVLSAVYHHDLRILWSRFQKRKPNFDHESHMQLMYYLRRVAGTGFNYHAPSDVNIRHDAMSRMMFFTWVYDNE